MTIAASWLMWSSPGHPDSFLFSTLSVPSKYWCWACSTAGARLFTLLVELQEEPVSPFLQSVKIPLMYKLLPSVLSNQQACGGYTLSHIRIIKNRIVHSITPLDTLLATGLQDDFVAQISTPWPYLYRQF